MRLSKTDLLSRVADAIELGGGSCLFSGNLSQQPVHLNIALGDEAIQFALYIYNVTHGGKNRPSDEYRIQVTSVDEISAAQGMPLLLGYHYDTDTFTFWDSLKHLGAQASSPSHQTKYHTLTSASADGVAVYKTQQGEIVISCSPGLFLTVLRSMHLVGPQNAGLTNSVGSMLAGHAPGNQEVPERERILAQAMRYKRSGTFRERVITAYGWKCAISGIQLKLLEAAHILPVAAEGSSDETSNGICLSPTYHTAYDRGLIALLPDYTVAINMSKLDQLRSTQHGGGFETLILAMRPTLLLPSENSLRPDPMYLRESLRVRKLSVDKLRPLIDLKLEHDMLD